MTRYHRDTGSRPGSAAFWTLILSVFTMRVRVTSEVPCAHLDILHNCLPNLFSDVFVSPQTSLDRISTFAVSTINCSYRQDASVIILTTFGVSAVCQKLY